MTEVEFNPEATDGDKDVIVQEEAPLERPVEEVAVNLVEEAPVAEEVAEELVAEEAVVEELPVEEPEVIKAPEPVEETPAITHVEGGVIGSGTVKKKPAPKKAEAVEGPKDESEKVAIFASRNVYWQGFGKIARGYSIVSRKDAEKWVTLAAVRLATPEEIKANLG